MKKFEIPQHYRSSISARVKDFRRSQDLRKQDFTPTVLDFGPVQFILARHFGFCYGVENAIEKSYKALEENSGKNVYLLSQMIHNPEVNRDLQDRGIRFIMDTDGTQLIPWERIQASDVVIIPAFGTTREIEELLKDKGVNIEPYNTTCPFVEKVWNRAAKLGKDNFTVIIHGKPKHEETRATFSHSAQGAPSVIVRDMDDAIELSNFILGHKTKDEFYQQYQGKYSMGFQPDIHFQRIGVVNQTTMLATETASIAEFFKEVMIRKYGAENIHQHFADTRDTLCYATNDNQDSTLELLKLDADVAVVVGGYNSSNTSHIVALCETKFHTFFISSDSEIISREEIHHFDYPAKTNRVTYSFLPEKAPARIIVTSGASCPDTVVDRVILRILSFFPNTRPVEEVMAGF
ncbi:MAG: 4-hydroxy-3-methylbut-2-enyl diphosphate reductase [Cyclobacteriaceae bacterium]|nr:4-hydroxy-3-methylbut-2-enyl diphosphate reductase [Cyclobacteriaceae bacterium]